MRCFSLIAVQSFGAFGREPKTVANGARSSPCSFPRSVTEGGGSPELTRVCGKVRWALVGVLVP